MSVENQIDAAFSSTDSPTSRQPNAIPAPKTRTVPESKSRPKYEPVNICDLGDFGSMEWLWQGYLSPQHITLLTALWKAGKSTLIGYLVREFGAGGSLGTAVAAARVLIVSEESGRIWAGRRDKIGIGGHVDLLCRPFRGRSNSAEWVRFIARIADLIRDRGYQVLILDTISSLWPVIKENDAGEVITALSPLHLLTDAGASVLIVHHNRKGDGSEAQAARGSGALGGFVDVIVELRRHNPASREDRRRVLTSYSRFDETPTELVIELAADGTGYATVGTKSQADYNDRLEIVHEYLPTSGPGLTAEEILAQWPVAGLVKPGLRKLRAELEKAFKAGAIGRTGEGKKNDPYRFRRVAQNSFPAGSNSIDAGIESAGLGGVCEATSPEVPPDGSALRWATEA